MVKLLLAAPGIDVNAPATDGRTPLSFSAWDGHDAIVKLLLAVPGIDVNAADTSGWAAITWAAFNGKEAVIKALCAVPEIIVDVAEVKRHLEDPPEGWQRKYSRRRPRKSIDEQDKCVRLLEQFVESKGGEA
ncbi:hypothetical protein DFP72DRAFT_884073 [Ephemerocybe angulata]|uniref:Uncharacterized protein n=1 Tax=Ephemerocybe angulata TaxID=980116 RepID=A0A8H6MBF1_9AGAR|nr:hypothetical protein DFP72DRAFT_884073 [Tulosesus angulatus]